MEITIEVFDAGAWKDAAIIGATSATAGGINSSCTFEYTWDYAFSKTYRDRPVSLTYPVNADLIRKNEWPAFLYDIIPQGNGRRFLLASLNRPVTEGASADFELLKSGAFNPIGRLRVKEAVQFYQAYIERHQNENLNLGMQLEEIVGRRADFVERMHIHGMLATGTTGIQGVAPKFMLTQDNSGLWFADGQIEDHQSAKHWIVKLPRGNHSIDLKVLNYDNIDANKLTLFDAVKEMRKVSNLTQPEFADFSGVSVKIIKDIENNKGNPTLKTLRQLGNFFGLELSYTRKSTRQFTK